MVESMVPSGIAVIVLTAPPTLGELASAPRTTAGLRRTAPLAETPMSIPPELGRTPSRLLASGLSLMISLVWLK